MAMISIEELFSGRAVTFLGAQIFPDGARGTRALFDSQKEALRFALAYADKDGATFHDAGVIRLRRAVA